MPDALPTTTGSLSARLGTPNDLHHTAVAQADYAGDCAIAQASLARGANRLVSRSSGFGVGARGICKALAVIDHGVSVENLTARRKSCTKLDMEREAFITRDANTGQRPMRFYELEGMVYCRNCRDNLLTNAWRVATWTDDTGRRQLEVSDEPPLRPRSFEALGDRPWAGNAVGERYAQCDDCNGQWGPDA